MQCQRRKNMKTSAVIFSLALLCSCSADKEICGTYQGTLPAADGPGIATTITFGQDHSYTEELVYIDKDDGTFIETGKYRITDNIMELASAAGEKSYYKIENGQIRRLDMDQKSITGPLADYYILKQSKKCN